jgi:hypothetical protein
VLGFKKVPVIHIFRLHAAGEKKFGVFFLFRHGSSQRGNESKRRKPERRAKLSNKTAPSKSEKKTFSNLTKENQTNIYIFDFTKDEGTTFK